MEPKIVTQAGKYLSAIRLHRYNLRSLKTEKGMMELYFLNVAVSQEVLCLISIFEVIFRNKIHEAFAGVNYLDQASGILSKRDYEKIKIQIKEIMKEGNPPQNIESRLLSNLTLGFWCKLFKDEKLWANYLSKIFEKEKRKEFKITFGKINKVLGRILLLRNKIAHHGRIIFKREILLDVHIREMIDLTMWLINKEDGEFSSYLLNELSDREAKILGYIEEGKQIL